MEFQAELCESFLPVLSPAHILRRVASNGAKVRIVSVKCRFFGTWQDIWAKLWEKGRLTEMLKVKSQSMIETLGCLESISVTMSRKVGGSNVFLGVGSSSQNNSKFSPQQILAQ